MFGFSFSELIVICVVALIAVGPQKLPGMLRTLGTWIRKLRHLTTEVRTQTGIDELLRAEGLHGGLTELRSLMRGHHYMPSTSAPVTPPPRTVADDPYAEIETDVTREYPIEGVDAYGALADDLLDEETTNEPTKADAVPVANSEASTKDASQTSETTQSR